jgi:hypothetical protein
MKKLTALIIALALAVPTMAQPDTIPVPEVPEAPEVPDFPEVETETEMEFKTPDKTKVTVGENEIFIIEDSGDTTRLQLGKKGMSIVEAEDGYKIDIMEMEDDEEEAEEKKPSKKKFKPHFAGFEVGLNNFMNPDFTLHTGTFMNLNTARSWNYNLNFLEYGIGLGTSYAGLVTGMGFEWSNYVFDANNSIEEDANGEIIERITTYEGINKSKLATTYLTAPLLFEVQIPAGKKRVHMSAGVIGGLKIGSRTKIKYNDGRKQKEVLKDDFSLSPFRYGATFRIGYRAIELFANYYFSPMFGETGTPELYPFSIGLNLASF